MTNAFAFPCQKILKKHSDDEEIALILKDIENAKQGVMTFSKEVKKYMLQFIHARYDDNQEVMSLIEVLQQMEQVTKLSIFSKSSNCKTSVIFGTIFCMRTARGKLSEKPTDSRTRKKR